MSIVGAFPSTLQNGTLEDATQVMSLFAYIQSQVNGNACPATTTSAILKGNGAGGTQPAVPGSDYQIPIAPGSMIDYGGPTAPSGWLLCDGSAISRSTYSALFTAIGTTWGVGDGLTTFNVPDLRRRATIGAGGTAVAGPANTLGSVGGEEKHVLTTAELAAHNHPVTLTDPTHTHPNTLNDPRHAHNVQGTGGGGTTTGVQGNNGGGNLGGITTDQQPTGMSITNAAASTGITASSASAGSGNAHNNMQPSAVVNKIIKT